MDRSNTVLMAVDEKVGMNLTINLNGHQQEIRTKAIKKLRFDDKTANLIYQKTKGYLNPLLCHLLMQLIDYHQPDWPETISANALFAMLFATEWKVDNPNDKEIMEVLSGISI